MVAGRKLPWLEHTPVGDIKCIHSNLLRTFHSHKTRPLAWRLSQLRKLWWGIKDAQEQLFEACKRDLGKPHYETYILEVGWVLNEIIFVCNNLEQWVKDKRPTDIPLLMSTSDSLLTDESFGPIIPVLPVEDLDEAIRIANEIHSTPLGVCAFGNTSETNKILDQIRSGGASINDGFIYGSIPTLEFGGVGDSGQDSYRGKVSFDCFTHRRVVTYTSSWAEALLSVRYPPYAGKLKRFKFINEMKPTFDRAGRVKTNPILWLASLLTRMVAKSGQNWCVVQIMVMSARQSLMRSGKL